MHHHALLGKPTGRNPPSFTGSFYHDGPEMKQGKIKKQNMTEYIAFGPFIVLATAVIIYMPNDVFITMLSKILRIS